MKLTLCTLAICLSILASVLTTKELIHAEGRKIRSSVPKALTEPVDGAGRPESLVQKLDALNAQLGNLSRRLASLEDTYARQNPNLSSLASTGNSQALTKNTGGLSSTFARLDAVSDNLAALTTYLDQSFEHMEKTVTETAASQHVTDSLEAMTKKVDAIDSYFTPLYAFLGLVYDPANEKLLKGYPSVDIRINELFLQLEALQKDVSAIRKQVTPITIEPTKHPRD
ncbi:MAG: hypothetical protein WCK89_11160 [bacterium]